MTLFILIFSLVYAEAFSFCHPDFRVPLSDFKKNVSNTNQYRTFRQENIIVEDDDSQWGCICNEKICIWKCCDMFKRFTEGNCNKTEGNNEFNNFLNKSDFRNATNYHIVYSEVKCDDKNNFFRISFDNFQLLQSGSVFIKEIKETYDVYNYCLETFSTSEQDKMVVLLCAPNEGITQSSIAVRFFLNDIILGTRFDRFICLWSISYHSWFNTRISHFFS